MDPVIFVLSCFKFKYVLREVPSAFGFRTTQLPVSGSCCCADAKWTTRLPIENTANSITKMMGMFLRQRLLFIVCPRLLSKCSDVRYALACRYLAMESSSRVGDKLKHIGHNLTHVASRP